MPEPTNRTRADWAREAVEKFASIVYGAPQHEPLDQKVYDLIADLQHLARLEGLDWKQILRMADQHHRWEVKEDLDYADDDPRKPKRKKRR